MAETQSQPPDLVVISPLNDWTCERAITLAVVASVRHVDIAYDDLLMAGGGPIRRARTSP